MQTPNNISSLAGDTVSPSPHPMVPINIVVEVDSKDKHEKFETKTVTGKQIREAAGAPLTDDLVRLIRDRPSGGNVGLTDVVEIVDGDKFLALPQGSVS